MRALSHLCLKLPHQSGPAGQEYIVYTVVYHVQSLPWLMSGLSRTGLFSSEVRKVEAKAQAFLGKDPPIWKDVGHDTQNTYMITLSIYELTDQTCSEN